MGELENILKVHGPDVVEGSGPEAKYLGPEVKVKVESVFSFLAEALIHDKKELFRIILHYLPDYEFKPDFHIDPTTYEVYIKKADEFHKLHKDKIFFYKHMPETMLIAEYLLQMLDAKGNSFEESDFKTKSKVNVGGLAISAKLLPYEFIKITEGVIVKREEKEEYEHSGASSWVDKGETDKDLYCKVIRGLKVKEELLKEGKYEPVKNSKIKESIKANFKRFLIMYDEKPIVLSDIDQNIEYDSGGRQRASLAIEKVIEALIRCVPIKEVMGLDQKQAYSSYNRHYSNLETIGFSVPNPTNSRVSEAGEAFRQVYDALIKNKPLLVDTTSALYGTLTLGRRDKSVMQGYIYDGTDKVLTALRLKIPQEALKTLNTL